MQRGILLIGLCIVCMSTINYVQDWGFYGHKLINRMAVFCLPTELIGFYKVNIDRIESDAVNADRRRYAVEAEAKRHYIDLDHWGRAPFASLPRSFGEALVEKTSLHYVSWKSDTVKALTLSESPQGHSKLIFKLYNSDSGSVLCDSVFKLLSGVSCDTILKISLLDTFTEHGILPYYLLSAQRGLTQAFREQDLERILQLSADMGHYIGDAHVPLHTTSNYDGQLTGQDGLHAFWESRIPELLADEYDFLVGRAEYIENPEEYYWDIVLQSHALVDSVLTIEAKLASSFPDDQKHCFVGRGQNMVTQQCPEYVKAFSIALKGMVERRMRDAIHSIACAWYTAWIDAGSPPLSGDINSVENLPLLDSTTMIKQGKEGRSRAH